MTPKEKAESLLRRMTIDFSIDDWQSKQCALVAVDEIIKALRKSLPEMGKGTGYWSDVRTELEKL